MSKWEPVSPVHRANYTFELGVWHATCRVCGYSVTDPTRRRAAAYYRHHIRKMATEALAGPPQPTIDLTDDIDTRHESAV
jgi:hypothetical protein